MLESRFWLYSCFCFNFCDWSSCCVEFQLDRHYSFLECEPCNHTDIMPNIVDSICFGYSQVVEMVLVSFSLTRCLLEVFNSLVLCSIHNSSTTVVSVTASVSVSWLHLRMFHPTCTWLIFGALVYWFGYVAFGPELEVCCNWFKPWAASRIFVCTITYPLFFRWGIVPEVIGSITTIDLIIVLSFASSFIVWELIWEKFMDVVWYVVNVWRLFVWGFLIWFLCYQLEVTLVLYW